MTKSMAEMWQDHLTDHLRRPLNRLRRPLLGGLLVYYDCDHTRNNYWICILVRFRPQLHIDLHYDPATDKGFIRVTRGRTWIPPDLHFMLCDPTSIDQIESFINQLIARPPSRRR